MDFVSRSAESSIDVDVDDDAIAVVKGVTMCGDCVVTAPGEEDPGKAVLLPPVERIVCPRDIADIGDEDESICIVGTREGKVTRIRGLERSTKLKVEYAIAATGTNNCCLGLTYNRCFCCYCRAIELSPSILLDISNGGDG